MFFQGCGIWQSLKHELIVRVLPLRTVLEESNPSLKTHTKCKVHWGVILIDSLVLVLDVQGATTTSKKRLRIHRPFQQVGTTKNL